MKCERCSKDGGDIPDSLASATGWVTVTNGCFPMERRWICPKCRVGLESVKPVTVVNPGMDYRITVNKQAYAKGDIGLSRAEWRALCSAVGLHDSADVPTLTRQAGYLYHSVGCQDGAQAALRDTLGDYCRRANELADRCGELESELAKAIDENTYLRGLLHRAEEKR